MLKVDTCLQYIARTNFPEKAGAVAAMFVQSKISILQGKLLTTCMVS